jgi:hypothetical protein
MNPKQQAVSANFGFLSTRYPELERIGARCERYFSEDPIISLMTVRRFGEVLEGLKAQLGPGCRSIRCAGASPEAQL